MSYESEEREIQRQDAEELRREREMDLRAEYGPDCPLCADTGKVPDHEDDKKVWLRCPRCNAP